MRRNRAAAVALAVPVFLVSQPARAQERPTLLERVRAKLAANAGLRELAAAPPALGDVRWMVGRWNAVVKTYGTAKDPEKIEKATRVTRFEIGGRWLVSRNTGASPVGEHAVEILGFDPFQRAWRWQFFSSAGRGTNAPLVSDRGWDGDRLVLSGTFSIYGESADVTLRLQKTSGDEYYEVFEEKLPNDLRRPFLEYHYTRARSASAKRPAGKPATK